MTTYKIKEGQNGLDVVNNTYAGQDYVSTVYLDNTEFDVNLMQADLLINWSIETKTQTINDIANNSYTFVNQNVTVFTDLFTMTVAPGEFNVSLDMEVLDLNTNINYFPNFILTNVDDGQKIVGNGGTGLTKKAKFFETTNNLSIEVDTNYSDNGELYTSLNFQNIRIQTLDVGKINIGADFVLVFNNQLFIEDFTFLTNMNYVNTGLVSDTIVINVSNSLQSTTKLNSFLDKLLESPMNEPQNGGIIITSGDDEVLTGASWVALQSLGWTNTVI